MWDSICQENINPVFTTKKKNDIIIKCFDCEVSKAQALHNPAKEVSFFSAYCTFAQRGKHFVLD